MATYKTSFRKASGYYKCSDAVRTLSRKFDANPIWIWDVLGDQFNMERGWGCLLTVEEARDLESIIASGANGEW